MLFSWQRAQRRRAPSAVQTSFSGWLATARGGAELGASQQRLGQVPAVLYLGIADGMPIAPVLARRRSK